MTTAPRHTLVVPVKTLSRAKTRLRGFADDVRRELMIAFAHDAVDAAHACPLVGEILVVTDEPDLADTMRALGCRVLPDGGAGNLNAALRTAVAEAYAGPVAAMLGDLPCLLTEDLTEALLEIDRMPHGTGFVADAAGTGTTLLAAREAGGFAPHFGPDSRAAHRAAGATEVRAEVATLRQDVDTAEDLELAIALGVGPRTHRILATHAPRPD